ncbi:Uncharacterised nucleotidyltransferase [Micromonospora nigra]|uniref:Uncharacterized nucleotidyltransferase n=1 Tax=Micromonospora nigra TaxID=145857 RepID=A0A1C6T196_9ACTN|nr:nucleotidyltransferase family protein [Micromonospora nigra]SCL35429.1 Uncharacterised nucleotidyltransferase [Micromonospora nigra]
MSRSATVAAARQLALDATAVATCAALADRRVPAVLLKGAGLARRLGTEGRRAYTDVDLLVAPATFDLAERSLADLGYRSVLPDGCPDPRLHWYERPWSVPGPVPLTVDLHRGFHGVPDREAFWNTLFASVERVRLAGGWILVPDRPGTALQVALHAASPGPSTRPYADLERALDVFTPEVWRAAAGLAGQCGALPFFAFGLRLAPAGAVLAAELGLPRRATLAQWTRARQATAPAQVLARLADLPTNRERLRHLAPHLFPRPAALWHTSALARSGRTGLLLAYLVRTARYTASLPRAANELRAAARFVRHADRD